MDTMPVAYVEKMIIEFTDGRIWEINVKQQLENTDPDNVAKKLLNSLTEYKDTIKNLDFKKTINENGVPITNCFFKDTPENILATMVEDAPKDFKEPLYLQKSVSVSVPNNDQGSRILISIWVSTNESNDKMSEIIQLYFDWRFKDLKSKKTSMSFDENGILILNFN